MAAFREHIMFSTALGAGYGTALHYGLRLDWPHAAMAGLLCAFAGMLPDLDSDSGRPGKEIFGFVAMMIPLMLLRRLWRGGVDGEVAILIAVGVYLFIRLVVVSIFYRLTVHRGMFHSLPAALIAAETVFLVHDQHGFYDRLFVALGVLLGFLSHLVLDEIYSVDISGVVPKLKSSAGSALKLASKSVPASFVTWVVLGLLTYAIGVEQGFVKPFHLSVPWLAQATGK